MLVSNLVVIPEGEPQLVTPPCPTPSEVLGLSNLDSQSFLRFTIEYIFVYKAPEGEDDEAAIERLRNGLSRALAYYYPLAGRLRSRHDHKLEVLCNAQGAVFVRARANLTLNEFGTLHKPANSWKKLLHKVAAPDGFLGIPPLVVQVTRLRCGALIICAGLSHSVCDGLGSAQFLQAWSEMSRGSKCPSITPIWDRHLLQSRRLEIQISSCDLPEFTEVPDLCNLGSRLRSEQLVASSVCFERSDLLEMKTLVTLHSHSKCTSFEVLSAHVWRSWVRAMDLPAKQRIKLLFSVNVRARLEPGLPEGFYGNGFVLGCAETSVKELTEKPVWHAVKVVQRAKEILRDEYIRSIVDALGDSRRRPHLTGSLVISQWSRLGLMDVDFGWGRALHVGHLSSDIYCIFLPLDPQGQAVNVVLSVPRSA
ncbi:hypothetical protein KI387_001804, partial [Taxus chinensis]